MIKVQYAKYGTLSAALLLSIIMLGTSTDKQNLAFAQNSSSIIPDLEIFGNDDSSFDSSPNTEDSSTNDASTDFSGSSANDDGTNTFEESETIVYDEQTETPSTNEQTDSATTDEQEYTETNPLLGAIKNKINEALSGIIGP